MDLFEFYNVKAEKAKTMRRCDRLRNLTRLFRIIELCIALLLLSWALTRVPFLIRISGQFFRRVTGVVASHLFVFMLCNVIVATLLVKSKRLWCENPAEINAEPGLYEEFIENSEHRCPKSLSENAHNNLSLSTEDTFYQDKEIITEVNVVTTTCVEENDNDVDNIGLFSGSDSDSGPGSDNPIPKVYRRTKSDNLKRKIPEKIEQKLRRSETVKCQEMMTSVDEKHVPDDELSDKEFQRAVDDFIAKHLRFRRLESMAVVLHKE
ncbi:hypothetical protein K2173_006028 [Erythroxylum novogranatense]|uniref:Uncharacterized protein n=1 Tax=Erythroxylum novogranatense TaxID=1862640 RepID=A0AAV8TDH3_9ROSI|nr:hypothetical protein K2173_006028 [Erythroxylum novogranatense]